MVTASPTLGEYTRAWKTKWVPGEVKAEDSLMPLNAEESVREEVESPPWSPSDEAGGRELLPLLLPPCALIRFS